MTSVNEFIEREKKAKAKLRSAQRARRAAEKKAEAGNSNKQQRQAKSVAVQPFPDVLQDNWNGPQHRSGRAHTQRTYVGGAKKFLAIVDGKPLSGTYAKRRHARAACSQALRRLGLKAGVDWIPEYRASNAAAHRLAA